MPNYFNSYNPWTQLAVMGRTIGESLAGEMYRQPQLKYELARQQQQDAQNEWYKQQQLKLAQEDNDRQLATSLLQNQGLQLNNQLAQRNAAIGQEVAKIYNAPKSTNPMDWMPEVVGGNLESVQAEKQNKLNALGAEQAALRGSLPVFQLGQERQENLMTLGAMKNTATIAALQQRSDEFQQKQQLAERRLQMDQEYKEAMADATGEKLRQAIANANYMRQIHERNGNIYAANFEMMFAKQLSDAVAAGNKPLVNNLEGIKAKVAPSQPASNRYKVIEVK